MTVATRQATSFLDPAILARIGNLELLAKVVVEGFINGLHRSPHLGASTDFAEHRPYMPGDDIRRIDWRLFGRTDRHYVKEYEADTNTNVLFVLDVSRSMRYAREGRVSKLAYGCFLAAALAYLSARQRDRVGLVTFADGIVDSVPPSAKHLRQVLQALHRAEGATGPDAPGVLGPVMRIVGESLRRRCIVVLLSDLYEEPDDVANALGHLRGRGNDVIVAHLLDRDELEFPFRDAASFVDAETRAALPVIPEYLRAQYRDLIRAHSTTLARRLGDQRMDYHLYDTSRPLDGALFNYLAERQRLGRVR